MNTIYMVHPNNRLTKLDKFTIPNLESYKKTLESQIKKLSGTTTKKQETEVEAEKILTYKQVEKNYITSYLNILKLLESVQNCCKKGCSYDYDYEQEDEILNNIEREMAEFKKNEAKLKELKGDVERRESIVKIEQDLVENVQEVENI